MIKIQIKRFSIHIDLTFMMPALSLILVGCQTALDAPRQPSPAPLAHINTLVNQQGRPCPQDYCLDDWPEPGDLNQLEYWDCKAYAIAKADRLIHQHGYDPARLEYILISGLPLRVTHTALLVDGHWVLDIGLRCQVCTLEQFTAGLHIDGRLPVTELRYARQALRTTR